MATPQPLKVLYHIHPNLDTLDFTGPLEILSHALFPSTTQKVFSPTITAVSEFTTTNQSLIIQRHIPIAEAYSTLSSFDVLVIPGGGTPGVLEGKTEPIDLIKAFCSLPPKPTKNDALKGERILLSVCTGSLILAEAGVLSGLSATTHPSYYGKLREIVATKESEGGEATKVVEERFVVNKTLEEKALRTITCGGVSCGLDGSLWLIEYVAGKESKEKVMAGVQYAGRDAEGIII